MTQVSSAGCEQKGKKKKQSNLVIKNGRWLDDCVHLTGMPVTIDSRMGSVGRYGYRMQIYASKGKTR